MRRPLQGRFCVPGENSEALRCMNAQLTALPCFVRPAAPTKQSCVVDPGAVKTDVWRHSHWLVQRAVDYVYAPPDGKKT